MTTGIAPTATSITTAAPAGATAAPAQPLQALSQRTKLLDPQALIAYAVAAQPADVAAAQQSQAAAAQQTQAVAAQQAQAAAAQQAAATPTAAAPASTPASSPTTLPTATRGYHNVWTAHIAQFAGKFLPNGPSMRPNCGPASATIALRLAGLDIPGFDGQRDERVLDTARTIATGQNNVSTGTTDTELERLIQASGGRWTESTDTSQILSWARQGVPVIISGNPSKSWDKRFSSDQIYTFDGGHWVTLSGYDQASGKYIVNDPLSQIGPIYVSAEEVGSYLSGNGNLGIAVSK